MHITVFTRNVYGKPTVYAADAEQARALTLLTNCKTLEHRHLQGLEALGFTLTQIPDPQVTTAIRALKPIGVQFSNNLKGIPNA